jgi:gliding motility-associated lipoprotein GldH
VRYLILALFVFTFLSCSKDVYFQQKEVISNAMWSFDDPKTFSFEIKDTSSFFDLILDVKHATDFSYENLYVKIQTVFPDGRKTDDQVSLELADDFDQWQGKCNSNFCTVNIVLQSGVYFREVGKHTLEIEQFNRENPIEGIKEMTLKLVKLDK